MLIFTGIFDTLKTKVVKKEMKSISLFCWNIGNPSLVRATNQGEWLRKRPEDIFILSEAKRSEGCAFLERYFQTYGYHVLFPDSEAKEYGTMMVSKYPLKKSLFSKHIDFLPSRVAGAILSLPSGTLEIIGVYVPSRDASPEKIMRKKRFLENMTRALKTAPKSEFRIFCGDFNVLEPDHVPHYSFFEEWEYSFYRSLADHQLKDAFRHINPSLQEYSWVGRTGDGYRYDHCFVSENIVPTVEKCFYFHEPRESKLSDHSAIIANLNFAS